MKTPFLTLILMAVVFISCQKDEPAPVAEFTISKTEAYLQESIKFANQSQNANSYAWDFGDGNTSTDKEPAHTYNQSGLMTVKLTAKGAGENSSSQQLTVYPGTASYQVNNQSSFGFRVYGFYFDGEDVLDLVDHGIISTKQNGDIEYTSRNEIYLMGELEGVQFLVIYPYRITQAQNNILEINDQTEVYWDNIAVLKGREPKLLKDCVSH